ncbi:MAG: outer membrane beta-barrel domain-containing protein [Rhodoferax sp.]|nr:outer membrane beta-barrel domain-containing protein [Rhodoferax sp.]
MRPLPVRKFLLALVTAASGICANAADPAPPTEQVIVPGVTRRDVRLPRFPSNDFELGAFVGTYSTQNFGSSAVGGLRLGYHITEDFFAEAVVAQTQVSDTNYRQILPGGIFATELENLSYYNLSVGYNVLPGEVFFGTTRAWPFSLYVIGGVGSTSFNQQRRSTFNFGSGLRVYFNDTFSVQIDARDHIFSLDLLGKNQTTQNLEFTIGLTAAF